MAYKLKNIECRYPNSNKSVLNIDELEINKSEIVFIIGASGVGKSTILETLGLMNNTIYLNQDHSVTNYFDFIKNTDELEDFLTIWNKPENYRAAFRKENLSFIFQNTNLFSTVSALDNMLMPNILTNDKSLYQNLVASIVPKLNRMFNKTLVNKILGTNPELDSDNNIVRNKKGEIVYEPIKMVQQLSGGQKQRLAFVRAINNKYSVLFADEPTGNLDAGTAEELMKLLVSSLKENNATAIIVSHDIDLAIKYASKVVYIKTELLENGEPESDKDNKIGRISKEWTYTKSAGKWKNLQNEIKNQLNDEELNSLFHKTLIEDSK